VLRDLRESVSEILDFWFGFRVGLGFEFSGGKCDDSFGEIGQMWQFTQILLD